MATVETYRQIIQRILTDHAQIPYAHGDLQLETVFDHEKDRYLLVVLGRENGKRVHGCLVHADIINHKIWIQRDGTEHGIANELVDAGVSREHIVLGFRSPALRRDTGFAAA